MATAMEKAPSVLMEPEQAFERMGEDQAAEVRAYVLGVEAVIWSMQWVKAGRTLRKVSAPLPSGTKPAAIDPAPHGINVWGHAGIGNMAEKLQPDADGGLTVLVQHDSPGADRERNWLPAPAAGFFLMMRMYQPEDRMYRGDYIVPPVTRAN